MIKIRELACPRCGANLPDTASGCSYCGAKIILSDDLTKFCLVATLCLNCGENNKDDYKYCLKCGASLVHPCPFCGTDMPIKAVHCPKCGINAEEYSKEQAEAIRMQLTKRLMQLTKRLKRLKAYKLIAYAMMIIALYVIFSTDLSIPVAGFDLGQRDAYNDLVAYIRKWWLVFSGGAILWIVTKVKIGIINRHRATASGLLLSPTGGSYEED
jgi:predicted amidophosphoribosyltransferase